MGNNKGICDYHGSIPHEESGDCIGWRANSFDAVGQSKVWCSLIGIPEPVTIRDSNGTPKTLYNSNSNPHDPSFTVGKMSDEPMVEFKSGAKRSEKALRYDLIPPRAFRRLAERYTLGAEKYEDDNWKKGLLDAEYVKQFEAHLIAHWVKWKLDGCKEDDNLSAMAWGCFALMEAEEAKKENK